MTEFVNEQTAKVIKGLECCKAIHIYLCSGCPYYDDDLDDNNCQESLCADALELLKAQRETIDELISADKALKLLKEQEAVVRCKHCKYAYLTDDGECKYCEMEKDDNGFLIERYRSWDWFCADGERRTGDA